MGRFSLSQLAAFVVACGAYFGGIPHAALRRMHGIGADADAFLAFASEATLAWLVLAAVYVYFRQLTPLAIHCLGVALSLFMLGDPEVKIQAKHVALATLGPCCWAAALISFPVSLGLLALSAALGRRVEPLTNRLARRPAEPPRSVFTK